MTARPLAPECQRRLASLAVVLVLVAVCVMAAGCVSQGFGNQTGQLPKEQFVILHHTHNAEFSQNVTGPCWHTQVLFEDPGFSFNESSGVLSLRSSRYGNETANESMLLFYDSEYTSTFFDRHWAGTFIYSLPANMSENITIETITGDGTISFRYHDIPVVLKPGERWENSSYIVFSGFNLKPNDCSEEYLVTETFFNAGLFHKNSITF
jgi:hypothetical protein